MPIVERELDTNLELLKKLLPSEATPDEIITLFYTILAIYEFDQESAFRIFTSAIVTIPESYEDFAEQVQLFIQKPYGELMQ
jgi:hypothetical protein